MIRRKIAIALLALGTGAGYGSAFCHGAHCHRARQRTMEEHVARVCVDAARDAARGAPPANPHGAPTRW